MFHVPLLLSVHVVSAKPTFGVLPRLIGVSAVTTIFPLLSFINNRFLHLYFLVSCTSFSASSLPPSLLFHQLHLVLLVAQQRLQLLLHLPHQTTDEQLGENFPEFFYGKRLFHSTIFDVPPTPKPKLPSHESVAAARRGEHEFPNPQPAPDTVAAFSAYEALPYVKFQQRKPSTKSKPLTALKLKVKLPSRSSKPSDDAAAAAAAAAEDEMETEEDPDPTAAVVDERAASEIAEAAAAAATAAAEGAAKIAPERHYLVHQKSWEDQINWESNTKPNLYVQHAQPHEHLRYFFKKKGG